MKKRNNDTTYTPPSKRRKTTRKMQKPVRYIEDVDIIPCENKRCNHKTWDQDSRKLKSPSFDSPESLCDLIKLGKLYHCQKFTEYKGLNLKLLFNLIEPLAELNNMIGMQEIKTKVMDQLLFFLQGLHTNDMLHTVITGPPGVGKTQFGKILGQIYKNLGILSKGTFKLVTRTDLIGEYLGHTAVKTQQIIDSCIGGVMFIDEAYSLGHSEKRDSFSKECIDVLTQNLSENRDLLCIIAGYKDSLEKCFFDVNPGLARRFTFRYHIDSYTGPELRDIFIQKIRFDKWMLDCITYDVYDNEDMILNKQNEYDKITKLFEDNISKFVNFGGDIETLLFNCKIVHCRKLSSTCKLSFDDINQGLSIFIKARDLPTKKDDFPFFMYS